MSQSVAMPSTDPMSGGNMGNGSMDMVMHMSFYWGKDAIILFSGWPNDSLGMYILACFFVLLLAVSIEVLSVTPAAKPGTNIMVGAFVQASVSALRMGVAYMVMLSIMSYNLGIFIAAVAGHFIGSFVVKARTLAMVNRARQNGGDPKV